MARSVAVERLRSEAMEASLMEELRLEGLWSVAEGRRHCSFRSFSISSSSEVL